MNQTTSAAHTRPTARPTLAAALAASETMAGSLCRWIPKPSEVSDVIQRDAGRTRRLPRPGVWTAWSRARILRPYLVWGARMRRKEKPAGPKVLARLYGSELTPAGPTPVQEFIVFENGIGDGTSPFPWEDVAEASITEERVAASNIGATLRFGALGALASKNTQDLARLTVKLKTGEIRRFALQQTYPQAARAMLEGPFGSCFDAPSKPSFERGWPSEHRQRKLVGREVEGDAKVLDVLVGSHS